MITDDDYKVWLADDTARRCLLIETTPKLGGVDTPVYLASRGYTTGPTDTPANTEYLDLIQNGVSLSEQVSVSGEASMSYGTVELENNDGQYDWWLDGVWTNRPITVLFGDVSWKHSDFRVVFSGIVGDIDSSAQNRLSLKLRDKLQKLNTAIIETQLGGDTENKEKLLPVLMGECHNIEPLLTDPAEHEYQFHAGAAERLIEVRDGGVPVDVVATLGTGKFKLTGTPESQLTVSAQGDNTSGYVNTVAGIVKRLVMNYGRAGDRLTLADIDTANFDAFDAAHQQPVGTFFADKANVLESCQKLAASLGAMLVTSRPGKLKLMQVNLPTGTSQRLVTEDDMVVNSFRLVEKMEVVGAVKLGYCQNWTKQTNLESGIPDQHRDMFNKEWLEVTREDPAVLADYRLHSAPDLQETFLLTEEDAIAEADRRLGLRKTPRKIYQYTGFADSLDLQLGDEVKVFHSRYDLKNGKFGIVVRLQPDWLKCRCVVQVMI